MASDSLYAQTLAGSPHRHWQALCTDLFFNDNESNGFYGLLNKRVL